MTGKTPNEPYAPLAADESVQARAYDPFTRGPRPVGVRTIEARDAVRSRTFPIEVWYPAAARYTGQDLAAETEDVFIDAPGETPRTQLAVRDAAARPGTYPLVLYSHRSYGGRRQATFLCTHLSSHGYVVAALDHSDVIAPDLLRPAGEETDEQRAARVREWIANRVPDTRFLLDWFLNGPAWDADARLDPARIGIVGHSFGGWTALATPETDGRIRAVVAHAAGGSSNPPPGIIPATLTFAWGRDVPTLYLAAEDDSALPLAGMHELFARTPATKRMVILRRADHAHFEDDFVPETGQTSREGAHLCVRGLTLAHIDATLRQIEGARQFWANDVAAALSARGVDVIIPPA